mgnify:CR=1 FL=1
MASINISLKKEAYDFLKNLKASDKSFSDVILGFKKEKSDIMRFFGALKDIDWAEREENMKKMRGSFSRRLT